MNKKIILSIAFLLSITTLHAGDYKNSEANNIKVVDTFWDNILINPEVSMNLLHEDFQFEFARQPFERTYRRMSNLDDMHENGIHDYMKFVKFGYGRATDHSAKDIRLNLMSREEGVEAIKKFDSVKPQRDLQRWLEYVDMTEPEFDQIADTFRDPRVWWIDNDQWWKHNIWGEPSAYGQVHLTDNELLNKFQ